MRGAGLLLALPCAVPWPYAAAAQQTQAPISAIDWLSVPPAKDTGTAITVETSTVRVAPLDAAGGVKSGVISSAIAGVPETAWQGMDAQTLTRHMDALPDQLPPSLSRLLQRLLLLDTTMPADLALARVAALRRRGMLAPAWTMIGQIPISPPQFAVQYDLALLVEQDFEACQIWTTNQYLSDDPAVRVHCLAMTGDWDTAATAFFISESLGDLPPDLAELLHAWLDPTFTPNVPPTSTSPLSLKLQEAVGLSGPPPPVPLQYLPVSLRDTTGWRGQLDAAETLWRAGSMASNGLLGFYLRDDPAASGGVWDRVRAVQRGIDAAQSGAWNEETASQVWSAFANTGMVVFVADTLGPSLAGKDAGPITAALQQMATPEAGLSTGACPRLALPWPDQSFKASWCAAWGAQVVPTPMTADQGFDLIQQGLGWRGGGCCGV